MSFKKIHTNDITQSRLILNKEWDLDYCSYPNDTYIKIYNGTKHTSSFSLGYEYITNNRYDRLVYNHINQIFYNKYNDTLDNTSKLDSIYFESSSINRPEHSFYPLYSEYKIKDEFPTNEGDNIRVLVISPKLYGDRIIPKTFNLSSIIYDLKDDGECNIYDQDVFVGNIFYNHGIIVITHPLYQNMFPLPPIVYSGNYEFDEFDEKIIDLKPLIIDRFNEVVNNSFTYILPLTFET